MIKKYYTVIGETDRGLDALGILKEKMPGYYDRLKRTEQKMKLLGRSIRHEIERYIAYFDIEEGNGELRIHIPDGIRVITSDFIWGLYIEHRISKITVTGGKDLDTLIVVHEINKHDIGPYMMLSLVPGSMGAAGIMTDIINDIHDILDGFHVSLVLKLGRISKYVAAATSWLAYKYGVLVYHKNSEAKAVYAKKYEAAMLDLMHEAKESRNLYGSISRQEHIGNTLKGQKEIVAGMVERLLDAGMVIVAPDKDRTFRKGIQTDLRLFDGDSILERKAFGEEADINIRDHVNIILENTGISLRQQYVKFISSISGRAWIIYSGIVQFKDSQFFMKAYYYEGKVFLEFMHAGVLRMFNENVYTDEKYYNTVLKVAKTNGVIEMEWFIRILKVEGNADREA